MSPSILRRLLTAGLAGTLVLAALSPSGAAAEPRDDGGPSFRHSALSLARAAPAPASRVEAPTAVERRRVVLTAADRPSSITPSPTPHQRLVRAELSVALKSDRFFAEVRLGGEPPSGEVALAFSAGRQQGSACNNNLAPLIRSANLQTTFTAEDLPTGWAGANCVVVQLIDRTVTPNVGLDALVGRLVDELPRLSLQRPTLLGSSSIGLVRGAWTTLDVGFRNAGPGAASGVTVSGQGAGVTVRRGTYRPSLEAGRSGSTQIRVRLISPRKTARIRLTASSGQVRTSRVVTVRQVKAPARPRVGKYRDRTGDITFSITRGNPRLAGFRIRTQTTCGAFPDIPTTRFNTYSFKPVGIPRNGVVNAVIKGKLYTARLRFRVSGGTVGRGKFTYSGPNFCRATESFTAQAVRR